jgi:hypothetical protein
VLCKHVYSCFPPKFKLEISEGVAIKKKQVLLSVFNKLTLFKGIQCFVIMSTAASHKKTKLEISEGVDI